MSEAALADLVPERALRAWVGDRLPGEGELAMERLTAGLSNEMVKISRGGASWVLRRPPRVANAPGAHAMAREFEILRGLDRSDVPHATALLLCEDPDVIGAPFYVSELVDGTSLYSGLPAAYDTPARAAAIAEQLFDALAAVHLVDTAACGLAHLGRPEGFTQRQVDRWMGQLERYRVRPLPDLDEAGRWLTAHVPETQQPTLIHGDYGLHNVLYGGEEPELRAVVDWETATIGDPLLDLGYLLTLWLEGDEPSRWTASALPYPIDRYPGRAGLVERYAAATAFDLSALDWYRAMSQLKVACILEGAYARHVRGDADDPHLATLGERVPNHAAYALAITRGEA
jgi:aminoglycoside phosphotransferase (APT) family kinase protein